MCIRDSNSSGIVNGVGSGKFNPDGTITRQEAAAMVARAAKLCGLDTTMDAAATKDMLAQFGDYRSVASWAKKPMAFCYSANILDQSDLNIEPTKAILRCEIAQMLYNLGLQFCSDAAALPASGRVIYTGAAPLTADAFTGTLYLGGPAGRDLGGMNITGTLVVRTDPNGTVTREQLAAMLYRYFGSPAVSGSLSFADASSVSEYAHDAMQWCVNNGIINGMDGLLNPQGQATRAQVSAMFARYIRLMSTK